MLLLQIIPFVVITCFAVFAARYFILHSLRTTLQRKQTLRSVILLLYFMPVFLQGLFLFCFALEHSYILTADFFVCLKAFFFKQAAGDVAYHLTVFQCAGVVAINALLLAVHSWLAGRSANTKMDIAAGCNKLLYLLFAALMLFISIANAPALLSMGISRSDLYLYNNGYFTGAGLMAGCILLFYPYRHSRFQLARYAVLAARIAGGWVAACFSLALLLFLIYILLHLFF